MNYVKRLSEVGKPKVKDIVNIKRDFTFYLSIKNKVDVDFLIDERLSLEEKGFLACLLELGNVKIQKDSLIEHMNISSAYFFRLMLQLGNFEYVKIKDFGISESDEFYVIEISSVVERL